LICVTVPARAAVTRAGFIPDAVSGAIRSRMAAALVNGSLGRARPLDPDDLTA